MEKIEENNLTIALNVLYAKKKKYTLAIFQNIIQIVIPKEEKWNYPTVNKLSALLIEITSKHKGDFY